jgi:hypothetical protein
MVRVEDKKVRKLLDRDKDNKDEEQSDLAQGILPIANYAEHRQHG